MVKENEFWIKQNRLKEKNRELLSNLLKGLQIFQKYNKGFEIHAEKGVIFIGLELALDLDSGEELNSKDHTKLENLGFEIDPYWTSYSFILDADKV